jgi:hypothetical protein
MNSSRCRRAAFCSAACCAKKPRRGRISFGAGAVEAIRHCLGDAAVLLVESVPFVAQFLHFGREARRLQRVLGRSLGALAHLNAGLVLRERFPAVELLQLPQQTTQPLQRRLWQLTGAGSERPDLVRSGARSLQLTGGERLFRAVHEGVHLMPRGIGFLLDGANLRQPALLDDDQRGLEALGQRGRSNASIQRLPPLRQLRVVDGCAGSELLGFDNQRFRAGARL